MIQLDDKDLKILNFLKENSKLTIMNLSKKTMIPITTIHNRIKRLEKIGIIKKYTIEINYDLIKGSVISYLFIKLNYPELRKNNISQVDVVNKIKSVAAVDSIEFITGDYELIVKLRTSSIKELMNFIITNIEKIVGIERIKVSIVLSTYL